jgi:hypothetical protein
VCRTGAIGEREAAALQERGEGEQSGTDDTGEYSRWAECAFLVADDLALLNRLMKEANEFIASLS